MAKDKEMKKWWGDLEQKKQYKVIIDEWNETKQDQQRSVIEKAYKKSHA